MTFTKIFYDINEFCQELKIGILLPASKKNDIFKLGEKVSSI